MYIICTYVHMYIDIFQHFGPHWYVYLCVYIAHLNCITNILPSWAPDVNCMYVRTYVCSIEVL